MIKPALCSGCTKGDQKALYGMFTQKKKRELLVHDQNLNLRPKLFSLFIKSYN